MQEALKDAHYIKKWKPLIGYYTASHHIALSLGIRYVFDGNYKLSVPADSSEASCLPLKKTNGAIISAPIGFLIINNDETSQMSQMFT